MEIISEENLYKIVQSQSDYILKKIHIIFHDLGNGENEYKVYHSKGYCFDISKKMVVNNDGEFEKWEYLFYSNYEGFKLLNPKKAIKLLEHLIDCKRKS